MASKSSVMSYAELQLKRKEVKNLINSITQRMAQYDFISAQKEMLKAIEILEDFPTQFNKVDAAVEMKAALEHVRQIMGLILRTFDKLELTKINLQEPEGY